MDFGFWWPWAFSTPTEASLHSFRTLHWSGPNLTALRRVGLAVRYVRADVQRSRRLRRRESAMLACGTYVAAEGAFDAAWAGIPGAEFWWLGCLKILCDVSDAGIVGYCSLSDLIGLMIWDWLGLGWVNFRGGTKMMPGMRWPGQDWRADEAFAANSNVTSHRTCKISPEKSRGHNSQISFRDFSLSFENQPKLSGLPMDFPCPRSKTHRRIRSDQQRWLSMRTPWRGSGRTIGPMKRRSENGRQKLGLAGYWVAGYWWVIIRRKPKSPHDFTRFYNFVLNIVFFVFLCSPFCCNISNVFFLCVFFPEATHGSTAG